MKKQWQILEKGGIVLDRDSLEAFFGHIERGVSLAQDYLQYPLINKLSFSVNEDKFDISSNFGYDINTKTLTVPIARLNSIAKFDDPYPAWLNKPIYGGIPSEFLIEMPFMKWLIYAGIEESIHYSQHTGISPKVKSRLPSDKEISAYKNSRIIRLVSEAEVEARNLVDVILKTMGQEPAWEKLDFHLKNYYSRIYNRSVEQIVSIMNGRGGKE